MPSDTPQQNENPGTSAHAPAFRDAAEEQRGRDVLGGAHVDHTFADAVAAATETPQEAAIDAANGLRGAAGRRPRPEDFTGLLTPEGNSGDIVGTDVKDTSPFILGEDGALGDTRP